MFFAHLESLDILHPGSPAGSHARVEEGRRHTTQEQGAGGREQGAGGREQGAGSREQGAGSREQGAGSRELNMLCS